MAGVIAMLEKQQELRTEAAQKGHEGAKIDSKANKVVDQ